MIDGWGWGWLFIDEIAKQTGIRVTEKSNKPVRYICGGGDKIEEIRNYFEGATTKIIHWGGTDVKNAIENGYNGEMKTYKEAIHLADGFNLIPELASIGIKAKMVTWTPKHYFGYVPPLGDRVCVYMPPARHEFFRYDLMKEVEKEYGKPFLWLDKPAEELKFVDVKDIIIQSKVLIRAPIHDGLSHTAMEFLTAGRTVLNTQDLPYCVKIEPHLVDILSKINTPPIPEASYFWDDFIDTHHIIKLFESL
jgi:hypothetical protein